MDIIFDEELEKHYFPCWECGIPVPSLLTNPHLRMFCPECKGNYEKEKQNTLSEYLKLKTMVAFERAMRILEKQSANLYEYKDESELVLELASSDPEKFASSHEMIAAMELLRNRIKTKTQQKILNHRVDFLLKDLKVVLEIDGYMHDFSKVKDSKRDVKILSELGIGWEVVRIPTKYIEENVKQLVPAIKAIYKYKQDIRKQNNGVIPEWFSKRENQHYKKVLNSK